MIKINLLEGARREVEKTPEAPSSRGFQLRVFIGALLLASAMVAAAYVYLGRRRADLDNQMNVEKREAARLAAIQAENARYEAELKDINRRIAAIQTLDDNRHGPSQLMTLLAGSVNRASGVYLISVAPKDARMLLAGASNSVASIANFVGALKMATNFQDVQLREYYQDDDKDGRTSFKFSLDYVFQPASVVIAPLLAPKVSAARASAAVRPAPVQHDDSLKEGSRAPALPAQELSAARKS